MRNSGKFTKKSEIVLRTLRVLLRNVKIAYTAAALGPLACLATAFGPLAHLAAAFSWINLT